MKDACGSEEHKTSCSQGTQINKEWVKSCSGKNSVLLTSKIVPRHGERMKDTP